jgi:hypothetical protein
MRHLLLVLFIACLFCAPVPAQEKAGAATSDGTGDEAKIETKYDRAKDETTVEFTQLQIAQSAEQLVFLSVSANYPGQKPKKPEDIVFIISVASTKGYRYPDVMVMQGTADGRKLPDTLMLNLDKRRMGDDYLETIGTRMKYDVFKRLTQAKTVELRLQNLTLQLNESQIAKMRALEALLR